MQTWIQLLITRRSQTAFGLGAVNTIHLQHPNQPAGQEGYFKKIHNSFAETIFIKFS